MNCAEVKSVLIDLLYGELADVESATVREHLAACPACRQMFARIGEEPSAAESGGRTTYADQSGSALSARGRSVGTKSAALAAGRLSHGRSLGLDRGLRCPAGSVRVSRGASVDRLAKRGPAGFATQSAARARTRAPRNRSPGGGRLSAIAYASSEPRARRHVQVKAPQRRILCGSSQLPCAPRSTSGRGRRREA